MQMRTARVRINTYGKAPARYGRNAYKVGVGDRATLVRAGWTHAGSGRGYEYVVPPPEVSGVNPVIEMQVPTDEEIIAVANEMHSERKAQVKVVAGFVVQYEPAGEVMYRLVETTLFAPGHWGERTGPEQPVQSKVAILHFGVASPWTVNLLWKQGEEQPPTLSRCSSEVVNGAEQ